MSGAYPEMVMMMLSYSNEGEIDILPACPDSWNKGCIKGMSLRGGVKMDNLSWEDGNVSVTLTSKNDQIVNVSLHGTHKQAVSLKAGVPSILSLQK